MKYYHPQKEVLNQNWSITMNQEGQTSTAEAALCVLMDIRKELRSLNRKLANKRKRK